MKPKIMDYVEVGALCLIAIYLFSMGQVFNEPQIIESTNREIQIKIYNETDESITGNITFNWYPTFNRFSMNVTKIQCDARNGFKLFYNGNYSGCFWKDHPPEIKQVSIMPNPVYIDIVS